MGASIPPDWAVYHARAANYERALGNTRTAEACERDARRAAHLLPVVGTQDADRLLAASLTAGGTFFPDLICNPIHIEANAR